MKVYQKPSIIGEINKNGTFFSSVIAEPRPLPRLMRGTTVIDSNHMQIINAHHKK